MWSYVVLGIRPLFGITLNLVEQVGYLQHYGTIEKVELVSVSTYYFKVLDEIDVSY